MFNHVHILSFCELVLSTKKSLTYFPCSQVRNHESARVSMPGQVCDQSGVLVAAKIPREEDGEEKGNGLKVERADRAEAGDCIQEEEGEGKKKFAVCVKGLDFPEDDLSIKLTEWIEVLGSLGADKIFLYNLEVHPNITKVRCLHNNHLNIEG